MTTDDLSALIEYRRVFDAALRASRAATDAGAATAPDGTAPVQAREEVALAARQAESDFWRMQTTADRQG